MYIDARKISTTTQTAAEKARDKLHTEKIFEAWFKSKSSEFAERAWEINDIGIAEKTGEFIKLVKEAEFTYSLGAFQSSIALIGVAAEDLCRFFADLCGESTDSLSQNDRVNRLFSSGLINAQTKDEFHKIRHLRNDCLHFNQCFKAKSDENLKSDALLAINTLKKIYAAIIGVSDYKSIDLTKLMKIIEIIASEASKNSNDIKGIADAQLRTRNILHAVTGVDLSLNLGNERVVAYSIFDVLEIDLYMSPPEITLKDRTNNGIVIVDLEARDINILNDLNIKTGDTVYAGLESVTSGLGTSDYWHFTFGPIKQ